MKNDSLKKIGDKILEYDNILIITHILGDGDTLGSAAALCQAVREQGKNAWIMIEDKVPEYLKFLVVDMCVEELPFKGNYISVAVDCSDMERFPERRKIFRSGEICINIDHHLTNTFFGDYNYVEPDSAATSEIIYLLLKAMKIEISKEAAEKIYAGINTDTGKFQNANTTARSHKIVSELYKTGIDHITVGIKLFQSVKPEKLMLENKIIGNIEMFHDGRGACTVVTQKMLEETGTLMEDTEGIVEILRSLDGVEISVFLKEMGEEEVKVSMRAKKEADVSKISSLFGGGGHVKAAGCTINKDISEAKEMILREVEKELEMIYG